MELIINDRIRNRKIEFFNSFKIHLKYNAFASTFSLDFYFDPDVIEQKEMACVGHYHIAELRHNNQLLLTVPTNKAIDKALAAGNLKPAKGTPAKPYCYPIQDEGLSLKQIAQKYLAPFGITMVVDPVVASAMNDPIAETSVKPNDTVKQYLTELATQKNINISHDEFGRLVFTRVPTSLKPVFDFNVPKGGLPGIKMTSHFNGQDMHSQITVQQQADIEDTNIGEETVTNPYVPFVFRPRTIIQSAGTNTDTALAASNALANELRGLTFTITMDRWDINAKIIKPKNTITVINPEIYLYKKTTLFIESIEYNGDQKEMTTILHCVLPEVYNGQVPKYIYAGINLH